MLSLIISIKSYTRLRKVIKPALFNSYFKKTRLRISSPGKMVTVHCGGQDPSVIIVNGIKDVDGEMLTHENAIP